MFDAQIAPKEDELRAFQAYQGTYDDLSPPEQFLYVMASVPRLSDKINVLILMHQFEVMHSSLLSFLLCTCVQVRFCCTQHLAKANNGSNTGALHRLASEGTHSCCVLRLNMHVFVICIMASVVF